MFCWAQIQVVKIMSYLKTQTEILKRKITKLSELFSTCLLKFEIVCVPYKKKVKLFS